MSATTIRAAEAVEFKANAVAAAHALAFLKDCLALHLNDGPDGDGVVAFNAGCVRNLRRALEAALRDGAGCNPEEIASVLAGDFAR